RWNVFHEAEPLDVNYGLHPRTSFVDDAVLLRRLRRRHSGHPATPASLSTRHVGPSRSTCSRPRPPASTASASARIHATSPRALLDVLAMLHLDAARTPTSSGLTGRPPPPRRSVPARPGRAVPPSRRADVEPRRATAPSRGRHRPPQHVRHAGPTHDRSEEHTS